jgi:hypothetical protein
MQDENNVLPVSPKLSQLLLAGKIKELVPSAWHLHENLYIPSASEMTIGYESTTNGDKVCFYSPYGGHNFLFFSRFLGGKSLCFLCKKCEEYLSTKINNQKKKYSALPIYNLLSVLRIWIRDPVPFWPLDPGSGIGFFRIPDLGSRIQNPYFLELSDNFLGKKFFR